MEVVEMAQSFVAKSLLLHSWRVGICALLCLTAAVPARAETDYPAMAREVADRLGRAAETLANSLNTEGKRAFAGRMRRLASDISMTAGVKGGTVVFAIEDLVGSAGPPSEEMLARIKKNAAAGAVTVRQRPASPPAPRRRRRSCAATRPARAGAG
jgi:hypothetical protein